jgi:thiamine-monophosphate kinase
MKIFKELEFISSLRKKVPPVGSGLIAGIGDDTAIIRCSGEKDLLVTCDLMAEGVHFSLDYFKPADIGWRALAANLSDIASMGGKPLYFTLSVAVPPHLKSGSFLDEFLDGLLRCATEYDVTLIGGDTSSSKAGLFIDIAMIGETEKGRALLRSGAKPGDFIYILGNPGRAEVGLQLFQAGWRFEKGRICFPARINPDSEQLAAISAIMLAHIHPEPCVRAGRVLSEKMIPSAMIDTSDGISTDLFHICEESGVGADLDYSAFDISQLNIVKDVLPELNTYHCIINGGEDYSLLFTAAGENRGKIEELQKINFDPKPRSIGKITDRAGIIEIKLPDGQIQKIKPGGWEHI